MRVDIQTGYAIDTLDSTVTHRNEKQALRRVAT